MNTNLLLGTLAVAVLLQPGTSIGAPVVKVVSETPSKLSAVECRRMLVGPGVNQPRPFPGYKGFVGWESAVRLHNGTWLVGFNAGYRHASPPVQSTESGADRGAVIAPTGGRAMIMRSTDEGVTWSKPVTLVDTPEDDRHPSFTELPDGTVLCTFFTYNGRYDSAGNLSASTFKTQLMRSTDGGKTWSRPMRMPSPFENDATDGPIIVLKDGSALLTIYGNPGNNVPCQVAVVASKDSGKTWRVISVVKADHELSEPGIAQLPSGRLVMISRPNADICWSDDSGITWTEPVSLGMRVFECSLLSLRDGTLLCLHGSYATGGLRAIISKDGGQTWLAPSKDYGFAVDTTVYGYAKPMELPDGSVFAVYIDNPGHSPEQVEKSAIWGVRMRVRSDLTGIEMLPAPGVKPQSK